MVIDAHCHFWRLERGDYHWLTQGTEALTPIPQNFLPEDYPNNEKVIAVQTAASVEETRFLLDLAARDLSSENAALTLRELASHTLLRGIRPMLQNIKDSLLPFSPSHTG
ncbi:hypothetical protein KDD30_19075 (plasmid) [Photobacterium sp. GJ3]|uniref:amidohydrolase family protein n=1 Tax=Photobacterium sp. GJ3 TaxID=2829502 RepID=UPI001B8BC37D|nr:hypothetical protein [Photobacterium sp. GJ3]QUJ70227.1 hypothetical protein KDD30_19075 [Photobacterium sp. GJ3]